MITDKIIIDIFIFIFEACLFWFYANTISTPKKSTLLRIVCIAIGHIALFITYEFNNFIATGVSIILVNTVLFSLLYEISFKRSLFHSGILLGIMVSSEMISMTLVSVFSNTSIDVNVISSTVYLIEVITSKLTYFIIVVLLSHFFAKRYNKEHNTKPYWSMIIMPLSGIIMFVVMRNIAITTNISKTTYYIWTLAALLVLFANIIIYIMFEVSQKNATELSELKTIQQQEEMDKRYFEVIEQSNKDMQIFAHDIKNHLIQIRNMEDNEKVKDYIDKIYPNIEKFSSIGISQNKMLDLILSKYIKLCESKNISFSVDVKTANLHYIDDTDLSTLLNNLLDNAIEAAEKTTEKSIYLKLFSKNKAYDTLLLSNSCNQQPISSGEYIQTTKQDKKFHGIGLKSVTKIVDKHQGVYSWNYSNTKKTFETIIAFPKK